MKLVEVVGQNIANRCKLLGLSQKELALRLGIPRDALNRTEKGTIAPKMDSLRILPRTLAVRCPSFFASNPRRFRTGCHHRDFLATLPSAGQETLVNLVADATHVMNFREGLTRPFLTCPSPSVSNLPERCPGLKSLQQVQNRRNKFLCHPKSASSPLRGGLEADFFSLFFLRAAPLREY